MNTTHEITHSRKRPSLALLLAFVLVGGLPARSQTTISYDLGGGTVLPTVSYPGTMGNLLTWIPQGNLPPGSILKTVKLEVTMSASDCSDSWLSDFFVYFDTNPGTPGTSAALQVGGNYGGKVGTVAKLVNWIGANTEPPFSATNQFSAGTDFPGTIDLHNVQVSFGDNYCNSTFSGTVTLGYDAPAPAQIISFGLPGNPAVIDDTAKTITLWLAYGSGVTNLAPSYTLSSGTCNRDSGTTGYNFTSPVTYTVIDGATTNNYVVTVLVLANTAASTLTWGVSGGAGGIWNTMASNWLDTNSVSVAFSPNDGSIAAIFNEAGGGGTINISPNLHPHSTLVSNANYTFSGSPIVWGTLTKAGTGTLLLRATPAYFTGVTISGGKVYLDAADTFSPSGEPFNMTNVTVNSGGWLQGYRAHIHGNLTLNGGRYSDYNGFGGSWNGPIYLATNSFFGDPSWWTYRASLNGPVSGPGGFTYDSYVDNATKLTLAVSNSYTGPTVINSGTLVCLDPWSLGQGGSLTINTNANGNAAVDLAYTGDHVVSALTLGGTVMPPGTYGSSNSPAANQNDTFFRGTGTVTVSLQSPPTPVLPLSSFSMPGGVPTFSGIATASGYTYYLVYKNNLTDLSWTRIGAGTAGTGGTITLTDLSPSPNWRFYRIEAQ